MATLTGQSVSSTYPMLLKLETAPISTVYKTIEVGNGDDSALQLSTLGIKSTGLLESTGATSLSSTLSVAGATTLSTTLGVTGVATFAAGTALLPAITTTGDANTGSWFPAADTVAVSTGGTERIRIDSSGNVGIGVTAPALKLHVLGATGYPATSGTSQTGVFRVSGGTGVYNVIDMGVNESTDTAWIQTTRASSLGTNDKLVINPNGGNVGIGTTGPDSRAHVYYTSAAPSYTESAAGLNLEGSSSVRLLFGTDPSTPYAAWLQTSNTGSAFPIALNPLGGNVGIGTTSPTTALYVSGVTTSTGGFVGSVTGNVTGNSATATTLATARDISLTGPITGTVSFNGSANVSIATTVAGVTPANVSDQANTSTGYFDIPSGTTAQQPASPSSGAIRFNTTTSNAEVYNGTAWASLSRVPVIESLNLDTVPASVSVTVSTITDVTGMTLSITPSSSTSRVRVDVRWAGEMNVPHDALMGLKRNGTSIGSAASSGTRNFGIAPIGISYHNNDSTTPEHCDFSYIDSPASTSSVTYQLTVRAGGTLTLYTNRCVDDADTPDRDRMTSSIILTEILA